MILLLLSILYKKLNLKLHLNKLGSIVKNQHFSMVLQPVENGIVSVFTAFKHKGH